MNKARLEWHRERQRSTAEYFRKKNAAEMAQWRESWASTDRHDPGQLEAVAVVKGERGMALVNAASVLDGERREGALKRAGRLLREEHALFARAARLRAGEKPLDEWALCRCGSAFQPGDRGYTTCYQCSSREWFTTSYACVFCDRRHSMSFAACFVCKAEGLEDEARFLRLMINRRDDYTCAMCGVDAMETGVELQVDKIKPSALGGDASPWNLQSMCTPCQTLKGKSYEKLDEREFWRLVQAYGTHLFEYLSDAERFRLLRLEPDCEREQIDFAAPASWEPNILEQCDEDDGVFNALSVLGARPISSVSYA